MKRPEDFEVIYKWEEGSVPPPHHYEYEIQIGPMEKGRITFCPDYPSKGLPVWNEEFPIDSKSLDSLYEMLLKKNVLSRKWQEKEDITTGDEREWLYGTVGNVNFNIPSTIDDYEAVEKIYSYIRLIVPNDIWSRLVSQHRQYIVSYSEQIG